MWFLETASQFDIVNLFPMLIDILWFRNRIKFISQHRLLRHLDSDLGSLMKSGEEFDWSRVPFVLEVSWHFMRGLLWSGC